MALSKKLDSGRDESIVTEEGTKKAKRKALTRVSSPFDFDAEGGDADASGSMQSSDSELEKILEELGLSEEEKDKFREGGDDISDEMEDIEDRDDDGEGDLDISEPVPMWDRGRPSRGRA